MESHDETRDDTQRGPAPHSAHEPGVVVLMAAGQPSSVALKVPAGGIELGRDTPPGLFADDDRVSRKHVRLTRQGGLLRIFDLGSKNGCFVDGQKLEGEASCSDSTLLRIGRSLLWLVPDIDNFAGAAAGKDIAPPRSAGAMPLNARGLVLGGRLRRAFGEIVLASHAGDTLLIRGESGSGKELAAQAYHEARHGADAAAPFVALNCAAIPEGLSESLFFGARRGAYSGATTESEGYVQAADGGTLFLDEVAELDPNVQAKLLRVLENREVTPLGASRPRKVTLSICAASHKQLRDEVSAGRFREDLYFRLGRPEVVLPPLRERLDELPWHIERELTQVEPHLHAAVGFVEACAQRPWPGNVRELNAELRRAAHRAIETGARLLEAEHLSPDAGIALSRLAPRTASTPPQRVEAARFGDAQIEQALAQHGGNVRGAARALGMHRNQLRRWLDKRKAEK